MQVKTLDFKHMREEYLNVMPQGEIYDQVEQKVVFRSQNQVRNYLTLFYVLLIYLEKEIENNTS